MLINAPSDKLNFVEGSNGPRLSCEASGEPQVQYRWLLLRGGGFDLANSKYNNNQAKGSSSLLLSASVGGNELSMGGEQDHAINQQLASGGARSWIGAPPRSVNDVPPSSLLASELADESVVELAGSISEQRGVTISTLDLSQLSLDRKQSGHYVCEASNRLGQSRQSVYVNVLCKY